LSHSKATPVLLVVLALGLTASASADTILFDFNSLAAGVNSANGADAIETYMEALYGSDITVARGAKTQRDRIEGRPTDMYLGNSDGAIDLGACLAPYCHAGAADTFLINRWDKTSIPLNERDRVSITFEDVPVWGLGVDWEIFPVTANGQKADITIMADGEIIFFSQLLGLAKEKGDLGHFDISFSTPVHKLEFIDWTDAPIGIDNLSVTRRKVPVPGTGLLLLAGLAALGVNRRRA
jgi:hypothetical protein